MADTLAAARGDVFANYGRNILIDYLNKTYGAPALAAAQGATPQPFNVTAAQGATPPQPFNIPASHDGIVQVGIIGGGMAGLYTALVLAYLGVSFQILEATDRIGGRCFTYNFKKGGEYDYYDVGAMRFPLPKKGEIGPHERLKDLFRLLELKLFDYIYKTPEGLLYYNGVHATVSDKDERFKAEALGVPSTYIDAGVNAICEDYLKPLADPLLKDMQTGGNKGWEEFKAKYDQYTTRSYLQFKYIPSKELRYKYRLPETPLSTPVINWLETFDKSSGWYDRALAETVLEAIAFGVVGPKPNWHCIDHGTSVLPEATLAKALDWARFTPGMPSEPVVKNSPVTSISPANPHDHKSPLVVTAGGQTYTFSHVISTIPLPNFSFIDTSSLYINIRQQNAIRQLQYGPSIKVGILFKSAWWKKYGQVGGQSFTDLPIRTIVYPSYGKGQSSKVLIASYCWTNDAERLGNLIGAGVDNVLKDVVLRNLATVHKIDVKFLEEQYVDMHSWNWNHNPWTGGAFAFFGPGQYQDLYGALTTPAAQGRLQWAGELLSVRHAWIVGALDSAWSAVNKYLILTGARTPIFKKFYDKFGVNLEWHDGEETKEVPGSEEDMLKLPPRNNLLYRHLVLDNPDQETVPGPDY